MKTIEDIRTLCSLGLSEDRNGEFYPIYDFDRIVELVSQRQLEIDIDRAFEVIKSSGYLDNETVYDEQLKRQFAICMQGNDMCS